MSQENHTKSRQAFAVPDGCQHTEVEQQSLGEASTGVEQYNEEQSVLGVHTEAPRSSGPYDVDVPSAPASILENTFMEDTLPNDEDPGYSRIPGFLCWLRENHGWVELFYKHGLAHTVMDDILELIDSPCRSWKTVISNITKTTPVTVEDFPVCPGHVCFATPIGVEEVTNCSICGKQKPRTDNLRPSETLSYIPLVPRLQEMITDERLSEQLYSYRRNRTSPVNGTLQDYFDSSSFESLCTMYGGEQRLQYDIFISAFTDGFQAFKNNTCDVWPLVAVLFNLPPNVRFMAKNVLPLMFIPNDVQPKDLQSYLMPFVNELLMTLEDGGVEASLPNQQKIRFRIHLIWFTADLAGLVKIAVEDFYSSAFRHYYYPTWLEPSNPGDQPLEKYDPRHLVSRTVENTKEVFIRLAAARHVTEKKRIATETGLKQRSVLLSLPSMKPFRCFPPDIMHLFYNVQMELLHHHVSGTDDDFAPPQHHISTLDEEFVGFATGISGKMAVKPRPLSLYTMWKAADHKVFTLSYCLIIFDGYLPQGCLDGLLHFVRIVDICFRPFISIEESVLVKREALKFFEHFESYYARHDPARVNFCKYVIHLLRHLGGSLLECGPLMCSSQYWVEKYIGWVGGRSNARYLPAKAMLRSAWFREAKRLFFEQTFEENDTSFQDLADVGAYRFLGPKVDLELAKIENGNNIRKLIAAYLIRKHVGVHSASAKVFANTVKTVTLWSRLQFVCGSDSQTARSKNPMDESFQQSTETLRPSCYVSVEMDATEDCADVYYGKLINFMELNIGHGEHSDEGMERFNGKYELTMIQWARGLSNGRQGQVFRVGSRALGFGTATVEDVSIIRRLIGVVEHSVPVGNTAVETTVRRRKQTYFIDEFQRIDHLLSNTGASADGVNRRLRGITGGR